MPFPRRLLVIRAPEALTTSEQSCLVHCPLHSIVRPGSTDHIYSPLYSRHLEQCTVSLVTQIMIIRTLFRKSFLKEQIAWFWKYFSLKYHERHACSIFFNPSHEILKFLNFEATWAKWESSKWTLKISKTVVSLNTDIQEQNQTNHHSKLSLNYLIFIVRSSPHVYKPKEIHLEELHVNILFSIETEK